MTSRRVLLLAVAVVVFAGGAALLVSVLDGGAAPGGSAPAADAGGPPGPAGAVVPTSAVGPPPGQAAPPEPLPAEPAGPTPWDQVRTVHRPSELGRELAAPVSDALDEASNRMDHCFEDEKRRMAHAKPPPPGTPITGPAVLLLHLEGAPGKLVVVGTEIESVGHSSRAYAECCEKAMQGYELAVPPAKPGLRIRYKLMLQ